jgi:hypothetical protein
MSTNRDIVSRIRSTHKLLSADNTVNDRTILAEAKAAKHTLIKQRLDKRLLYQTPTIFSSIDCLEMEDAPIAECCDYISNKMIAKSKYPLPKIGEGSFGLAIQGVFGVEQNVKLKEITPSRYVNMQKLGLSTKDVYYWIMPNRHLYVTDSNVKMLRVLAYFEEDIPTHLQLPECSCRTKKIDKCSSPLDEDFKCPGYLEDTVVRMVSQTLLSSYFRIQNDHTSDNKDDQTNKI